MTPPPPIIIEPSPEPEPLELAEIAVVEPVMDPEPVVAPIVNVVPQWEGETPAEPRALQAAGTTSGSAGASPSRDEDEADIESVKSLPEEIIEAQEPDEPPPPIQETAVDSPRLFIPDGLPIDEALLPPEIHRFAPWTWSWTEIAGVGLTVGAILSAGTLWLWHVFP